MVSGKMPHFSQTIKSSINKAKLLRFILGMLQASVNIKTSVVNFNSTILISGILIN